jgi:methylmalonyl-CoA/ethylmalonyl-CoA epimerase
LETIDPEGVVAKFIQKKGPGIHHLAFEVGQGELEYLSEKLKKEGYRLIYDRSQSGAHGMKVNFIHPGSAGGILIELTEPG